MVNEVNELGRFINLTGNGMSYISEIWYYDYLCMHILHMHSKKSMYMRHERFVKPRTCTVYLVCSFYTTKQKYYR